VNIPTNGRPGADAPDRPFVFAIPLVPKRRARDWQMVRDNLQATLRAMLNQQDQNFIILLAAEDEIDLEECRHEKLRRVEVPADQRLDFSIEDYAQCNHDAFVKRQLLTHAARALSARYLMYCDADDLVGDRLVGLVRDANPETGCVITRGLVLDHATGKVAECPSALVPVERFDRYCGTCIIFNMDAPPHIDKHWPQNVFALGHLNVRQELINRQAPLVDIDAAMAVYVINTRQNISVGTGNARRTIDFNVNVVGAIQTHGRPMTRAELKTFGLWA
jgi:hypothetical protein